MTEQSKPKRVLQAVTAMDRGGAETLIMNIYRRLDKTKMQFDFLTHRLEDGRFDEEIKAMGGRVFHLPPIRPHRYGRYFKALDAFFAEHSDYLAVHSHINENSGFVLRAAKKAGIAIRVAHSHLNSLPLDYKWPFRQYARVFLGPEQVTHYAGCTQSSIDWLFGRKATPENSFILKNGVIKERLAFNEAARQAKRAELGLGDKLVIGNIGRLWPQKNQAFALEVFAEIKAKRPNAELLIIGRGQLLEKLQSKAWDLRVADSVRFLGERNDVEGLLWVMDVFLFPSLYEGLPVALVEAQAAGRYCLASDAVTGDADIGAGNVDFLPLKAGAKVWAEHILTADTRTREVSKALDSSGFNIDITTKWLYNFYMCNIK